MSISTEQIKEKERKLKEILKNQISDIINSQAEGLKNINNVKEGLNPTSNVPNIGITLLNKISEISREFTKAGISMYVNNDKEAYNIESNFVGDAIRDDLLNKTAKGIRSFERYNNTMKDIPNEESRDYSALDFSKVNMYMDEYKRIDKEILEYSLKDNLKEILVDKIMKEKKSLYQIGPKVTEIIEKKVQGDLEKLGLSDLIPQIKEDLSQEILAERIDEEYNRLLNSLGKLNNSVNKKENLASKEKEDEGR